MHLCVYVVCVRNVCDICVVYVYMMCVCCVCGVCVCVRAACVYMEARDGPQMLFQSHVSCFAETGSLAGN